MAENDAKQLAQTPTGIGDNATQMRMAQDLIYGGLGFMDQPRFQPTYHGGLSPNNGLQLTAGRHQGGLTTINANSLTVNVSGSANVNSARGLSLPGQQSGGPISFNDSESILPKRLFGEAGGDIGFLLGKFLTDSKYAQDKAQPALNPYNNPRSALGTEFARGFYGEEMWKGMTGQGPMPSTHLFDLLIKKPPKEIFGGLDVTQSQALITEMVGQNFSRGGVSMRGDPNAPDLEKQAKEQMKYFSEVAAAVHTGTAVFKTQNTHEILYGMSRLGIGGKEGIERADPALMKRRMHEILSVADTAQEDPSSIVEGMLQTQAAMGLASGIEADPITGRRRNLDTFDQALGIERIARQIAGETGRVDKVSIGDIRSTVAAMDAVYGTSSAAKEYDAAFAMLKKGDITQETFDAYSQKLQSGDAHGASAYFQANIGAMSKSEISAVASLAPELRSTEDEQARAIALRKAGAGEMAKGAIDSITSAGESMVTGIKGRLGLLYATDFRAEDAVRFDAGIAGMEEGDLKDRLKGIQARGGSARDAEKLIAELSPEELKAFKRRGARAALELKIDELGGALEDPAAQERIKAQIRAQNPAISEDDVTAIYNKRKGAATRELEDAREMLRYSGMTEDEIQKEYTNKEGDARAQGRIAQYAKSIGISLENADTATKAAKAKLDPVDTTKSVATEEAAKDRAERTIGGVEIQDEKTWDTMLDVGRAAIDAIVTYAGDVINDISGTTGAKSPAAGGSEAVVDSVGDTVAKSVAMALKEVGTSVAKVFEDSKWKIDFSGTSMKLVDANNNPIGTLVPDGSATLRTDK